jgi:hypothetical protein
VAQVIPPSALKSRKGPHGIAVGSGQERDPGTQDGDKAAKEDYFAAVLAKEILSQFQFALIETDVAAVGCQKMRQFGCGKMEHVNCAFFISPPTYKRCLLF